MDNPHPRDHKKLLRFARELTDGAQNAESPGYTDRLINAAEAIEKHAELLDSLI